LSTLKNYTLEYFKEDVKNRFFPRQLIIAKNDKAFTNVVKTALKDLNELIYQPRIHEFEITSSVIDTTTMNIPGIDIGSITQIIPASDYYEIFENYRWLLGRTYYSFNILRNQDDFVDYILSFELHKQLMKRFRNYGIDYFHAGDKILLGRSFDEVTRASIFFLPSLKLDDTETEWELYDIEEKFVSEYLEALVSMREGRAQSEMKIMSLDTNAETLFSDGKERAKEVLEKFRKLGFCRVGKKF